MKFTELIVGSMQLSLSAWMGIDQATVSRVIWRVTLSIRDCCGAMLSFGDTATLKQRFYDIQIPESHRMSRLYSCEDCSTQTVAASR